MPQIPTFSPVSTYNGDQVTLYVNLSGQLAVNETLVSASVDTDSDNVTIADVDVISQDIVSVSGSRVKAYKALSFVVTAEEESYETIELTLSVTTSDGSQQSFLLKLPLVQQR
jgi:hypothetical protein